MTNLGKCATGPGHVYLNIDLNGMELTDIAALDQFLHLQNVNVSSNMLADVQIFGKLKHLSTIDVSSNELTQFLDFK